MRRTKHATSNYRTLKPFIDALNAAEGGSLHFISPGYMDLVIENLYFNDFEGNPVYSISHYSTQNGDLMADPDMEIAVTSSGTIIPRTFRNDYLGIYQEVFKENNGRTIYSNQLLIDLDTFLWQWLQNIEAQGFKPDINNEADQEPEIKKDDITSIILKALDEVEEIRQQINEGHIDEYNVRVAAANIAALHPNKEFHDRATWTDLLKQDESTNYHKRYYSNTFHL